MCVLDDDFKIQNGKWLSRGKHRWDVVKAHRRESKKGKKCNNCKKINRRYKKKYYVGKFVIIFKFLKKDAYREKSKLSCPM